MEALFFQVFLAEYDTKKGELSNLATVAQWNYETNITDHNSDIAQVENNLTIITIIILVKKESK